MQCYSMRLWHPQGAILELPQYFHDILHNGPFILSCEKWPVISVFWILEPLCCELTELVAALQQLECWVPTCLHIHNRKYCNANFGFLKFTELVSAISCQRNQYPKHSLLNAAQFQDFEYIMKYVLSQWSMHNLGWWPSRYWFKYCPLREVFDSFRYLWFYSVQIVDRVNGLHKD